MRCVTVAVTHTHTFIHTHIAKEINLKCANCLYFNKTAKKSTTSRIRIRIHTHMMQEQNAWTHVSMCRTLNKINEGFVYASCAVVRPAACCGNVANPQNLPPLAAAAASAASALECLLLAVKYSVAVRQGAFGPCSVCSGRQKTYFNDDFSGCTRRLKKQTASGR